MNFSRGAVTQLSRLINNGLLANTRLSFPRHTLKSTLTYNSTITRGFAGDPKYSIKGKKHIPPLAEEPGRDELPLADDDPNTFGTLSIGNTGLQVKDDIGKIASTELRVLAAEAESIYAPDEADDHVFKPDHPWNVERLRRVVFDQLRNSNLKGALDTFLEVVQDGGFQMPSSEISFIASALISACAKAGNIEMAFELFDRMKQRGLKVKEGWYTSLFNACANSAPWDSAENLLRIEKLRSHMAFKGFEPNQTHYHAMIKAYGRCGAIQSAFALVDEMRLKYVNNPEANLRITTETFNFLLQSCISEKKNGYRFAVNTWDKMLKMKIKPDFYSYKLFLRAIRECSVELPKVEKVKPSAIITSGKESSPSTGLPEVVGPTTGSLKNNVVFIEQLVTSDTTAMTELGKDSLSLATRPASDLQALLNIPENRFALLGGLRAFTIQMDIHKVRLDVESATELVQNVSTTEIPDVLMLLESKKLVPDVHFFNMAMKKYIRWKDVGMARKALEQFAKYNLTPNIITWGILAIGADTWSDCASLLREMDSVGVIPNDAIMGAFLLNARRHYNPRYVIRLLEEHVRREITPCARFVEDVLTFQDFVRQAILDVERGREVKPYRMKVILQTPEFLEYWQKLQSRTDGWVRQVGVKQEKVPWKQDTHERIERLQRRKFEPQ